MTSAKAAVRAAPPWLPPRAGPSWPPTVVRVPPAAVRATDFKEVLGDVGLGAGVARVPRILGGGLLLGEEGLGLGDLLPDLGVVGTELALVGLLVELVTGLG